jgi:Ca2+-binding RTX toxin-like protein
MANYQVQRNSSDLASLETRFAQISGGSPDASDSYGDRLETLLSVFREFNNNVISCFNDGYGFLEFTSATTQHFGYIIAGGYTADFYGEIADSGSTVNTVVFEQIATGVKLIFTGTLEYIDFPLYSNMSSGSSITSAGVIDGTDIKIFIGDAITAGYTIDGTISKILVGEIQGTSGSNISIYGQENDGNLNFSLDLLNSSTPSVTGMITSSVVAPIQLSTTDMTYSYSSYKKISDISFSVDSLESETNSLGGNDTITLSGSIGSSINAGNGNDTIINSSSNDVINGGDGTDTAYYSSARSNYTVTYSGGAYTVSGSQGTDTLTNVEYLSFAGTSFAIDSLLVHTDTTAPVLSTSLSSPANNDIDIAVGNNITLAFDESITKNTAKGAGTIQLKLGTKIIETYAMTSNLLTWSSDSVTINPKKDLAYGATYTVQVNANAIKDTAGNFYAGGSLSFTTDDTITVSSSLTKYTLPATINKMAYVGLSNFTATGNANNNTITTGSGNDTLNGGKGNDTLVGGEGVDTYLIDSLSDLITEYDLGYWSDDTAKINIATKNGSYTLSSGVETGILTNKVDFNLIGNSGNNYLTGNAYKNNLTGGHGYDHFEFNAALNAKTNIDTITDFNPEQDTVRLSQTIFKALPYNDLSTAAFNSGAGMTTAQDATDRIIYNTTTGALYYDPDGNLTKGKIVQFATLTGQPDISASDFQII